jgi:hypothetical protein
MSAVGLALGAGAGASVGRGPSVTGNGAGVEATGLFDGAAGATLVATPSRIRSQKPASSGFSFSFRVSGEKSVFAEANASIDATTPNMGRRWKIPIVGLFVLLEKMTVVTRERGTKQPI